MASSIPPPRPMNPIPGTTVDTSPSVLGLQPKGSADPPPASEGDDQEERGGLLSRTLDKLSRSKSLSSKKPPQDRKVSNGSSSSNRHIPGEAQSTAASEASSRAETPPPVAYPSRAAFGALGTFRGDGSMRAGTQTLIQALQAIPWEEDRDEDTASSERPSLSTRRASAVSSGSDDDDNEGRRDFMASSIHAIYRPVARSNRGTPATARPNKGKSRLSVPAEGYFSPTSESEAPDDELDDEESHEDFNLAAYARPPALPLAAKYDPTAPSPATTSYSGSLRLLTPEGRGSPAPLVASPISGIPPKLNLPNQTRQDSLATVRLKRKARLAEKLREVFGLREVEEVIAEMPSWLLRSVLLQGYMYLTSGHLCFFAHMPAREDQVLKSGSLAKKASRTKRWSKHWYVLKNDVLSWYQSSADPYFPHGNVDLRYAITCEADGERDFKLRTNQKTLHLQADSIPSRDEWVKAIKKVIFKAQNHGDSVKISLPFSAIIDVEKSSAIDFSDTIEVKRSDSPTRCVGPGSYVPTAYGRRIRHVPPHQRARLSRQSRWPIELFVGRIFGTSSTGGNGGPEGAFAYHDDVSRVKEVYESRVGGAMSGSHASSMAGPGISGDSNHLGFSILETPGASDGLDPQIVDKFRGYFALDEKEQLLGYFPGYLFRVLPLFGRLYVSTNFFCYRSGQPLRKTLMKIPLRDIISTEMSKAFRFGHHGLVIIIKGHEELFFEFNSFERRAALVDLLNKQVEDVQRRLRTGEPEAPSQSKKDALILEELEPAGYLGESASYTDGPRPPPESDTLPAVTFTSNSSTFLAFKPAEKLHITCLTIGSRGDRQPYIALAKRLPQDGHTCRIATHEEYNDWVEGDGIQFTAVGGDPAELMRICVENGMSTVAHLTA
ncbi:glycosyltransferase family 1 protein [Tulasnella calospora MUT 4182]|uniref:Sterol 3-beta-glucosyltransferase n=1 Tax=Tulasnella calospora MUT 4182 TaxID=1051891 RepID=A0A0C3LPH3_9AGAM|nr:glycosyltransferase family 1 protein [Tulasnella calospora MUT 4182]